MSTVKPLLPFSGAAQGSDTRNDAILHLPVTKNTFYFDSAQ
ncbi:hypothetical protein [Parafilimonas terrae]|nr:hypothetical protein [Parafilimonas terrae]